MREEMNSNTKFTFTSCDFRSISTYIPSKKTHTHKKKYLTMNPYMCFFELDAHEPRNHLG